MDLLVNAIKQDNLAQFKLAIEQDNMLPFFQVSSFSLCKPLHVAAEFGRFEFVKLLIENYKADPDE